MQKPPPLGLVVLGVMSGLGGLLMALVLLLLNDGRGAAATVLVRAAAAALAVPALVASEALIYVRPWFYRASLAFALTYGAVVVAASIASAGFAGIYLAMVFIACSLVVIVPILAYVRGEWMQRRRPPRRVPAPPRPWPVPGRTP